MMSYQCDRENFPARESQGIHLVTHSIAKAIKALVEAFPVVTILGKSTFRHPLSEEVITLPKTQQAPSSSHTIIGSQAYGLKRLRACLTYSGITGEFFLSLTTNPNILPIHFQPCIEAAPLIMRWRASRLAYGESKVSTDHVTVHYHRSL